MEFLEVSGGFGVVSGIYGISGAFSHVREVLEELQGVLMCFMEFLGVSKWFWEVSDGSQVSFSEVLEFCCDFWGLKGLEGTPK